MRGHLEKRHESSWTIVIEAGRDPATGKRRRIVRGFKGNKRDAEKEMIRLINELETGTYVEPSKLTLGAWLKQWLNEHAAPKLAETTRYRYEELIRCHISPQLGQIPLGEVKPIHLQNFYNSLLKVGRVDGKEGGLSPTTVRQIHAILHRALKVAMKLQLIRQNPADLVEAPQPAKAEPIGLDEEQVTRLLKAAYNTPHYVPLLLALATGMRRGEIYGLRWQDIDFSSGLIYVRQTVAYTPAKGIFFKTPKTHRSRRPIAIPPEIVEILHQHKVEQNKRRLQAGPLYHDLDLVFDRGDGQPHYPGTLSHWFSEFVEALGLPRITLHKLRHTHASILLKKGVNIKVIQERLGHASISTTMNMYSYLLPGLQEEAAAKIEEVIKDTK